jgi:uncharacterized protein
MEFREIVLKVTSLCNLNCSYCYVFNKGDLSYQNEPKFISDEIVIATLNAIEKHCIANQTKDFLVIFHGGEPLLIGKKFYTDFVKHSKDIIKSTKLRLALQTNGTLLNEVWCKLFNDLDIIVGTSLDGTMKANQNRVFRKDKSPAYFKIVNGIDTLNKINGCASLLSVINVNEDPIELYKHFKSLKVTFVDFLFPDSTCDLPIPNLDLVGEWLIQLFDFWYDDIENDKIEIRSFDLIVNLFLGNETRGNEVFGLKNNSTISIKTDGKIESVDSLKICGDGFTRTDYNVLKNELSDICENELIQKYYYAHQDTALCDKCIDCIIKSICGGGQLSHRYSKANNFNNPSVYCTQISKLLVHVQNRIVDDLPIEMISNTNINKLSLTDFQ